MPRVTLPDRVPEQPGAPSPAGSAPVRGWVTDARTWIHQEYLRANTLIHEILKFGAVGLACMVVDIVLFNLLIFGFTGDGPLEDKVLTAKLISALLSITLSYFANRHWAFKHRARTGFARELLLFFGLSFVAMGIALGCLWFSHYALGLTSPLADNISANVVGLGLGTLFRFWTYSRWVFPAEVIDPGVARLDVGNAAR